MDYILDGVLQKTQPTTSSVHVNRPLTNISVAHHQSQTNFIGDRVFPNIPVSEKSDDYYVFDRGFFNRNEMAERAEGTEAKGSGFEVTTDNFRAKVYAFKHDIPDQRRKNTDAPISNDRSATKLVTMKDLLLREIDFSDTYLAASIWTTDITGVAAAPGAGEVLQWNDAASTPIEDIRTNKRLVLESTGFEPNTLILGTEVTDTLYDHPDIIDRVKYGQTPGSPADINENDLAFLFKVPRIFTMKAIQNTAAEGATNVHSFIGGKIALLCYAAPTGEIEMPSGGYTFSWTGMQGNTSNGMRIKKFRIELIESDRVEIQSAFVRKLVSADLGVFFDDIIA